MRKISALNVFAQKDAPCHVQTMYVAAAALENVKVAGKWSAWKHAQFAVSSGASIATTITVARVKAVAMRTARIVCYQMKMAPIVTLYIVMIATQIVAPNVG